MSTHNISFHGAIRKISVLFDEKKNKRKKKKTPYVDVVCTWWNHCSEIISLTIHCL